MMRCVLPLLAALLLATAPGASAQMTPEEAAANLLPDFKYGVLPMAGVYYDPAESGTGLTADGTRVGDQDILFSTYYHYAANGEPTWMNFVGPVIQAPPAEYTTTTVPARISARWVRTTGGQCFDCPFLGEPTVAYPYEQRTMNLVDGRTLQMPASGTSGVRTLQLARSLASTRTHSQRLLTSGEVWQCRERYFYLGVAHAGHPEYEFCGWYRFERRPDNKKWRYLAHLSQSNISNGQGGVLPSVLPAWLDVPGLNDIPDQYQLDPVYTDSLVGTGSVSSAYFFPDATSQPNASYAGTLVIHPQTGEIHALQHCVGCTSGPSFYRDNAAVTELGRVFFAGVDSQGRERLVLRMWSLRKNGWHGEIELTRVPEDLRKRVLPNYVPNSNPN